MNDNNQFTLTKEDTYNRLQELVNDKTISDEVIKEVVKYAQETGEVLERRDKLFSNLIK